MKNVKSSVLVLIGDKDVGRVEWPNKCMKVITQKRRLCSQTEVRAPLVPERFWRGRGEWGTRKTLNIRTDDRPRPRSLPN